MVYGSRFFQTWERWYNYAQKHYIGPVMDGIPASITLYHDPIVGLDHRPNLAINWLWWAFMLLPLDRERARSFHEAVKKHVLVRNSDGSAFVQPAPGANVDDPFMTTRGLTLAHQLDDETAGALRAYVEANYEPTFDRENGEFHYGFGLGEPIPRGQYNSHLMLSEIGEPGGWWRLFNESCNHRFEEPTVCGVDYPRVGLSEARYDADNRSLSLRIYAATPVAAGTETRFRVTNLKTPNRCRVIADGGTYDRFLVHDGELVIEAKVEDASYQIIEE